MKTLNYTFASFEEIENELTQALAETQNHTSNYLQVVDSDLFITSKYAKMNKNQWLSDYHKEVYEEKEFHEEESQVTHIWYVTNEFYDKLALDLLNDFTELEGKGGDSSHYQVPAEFGDDYFKWPESERKKWGAQSYRLAVMVYSPGREVYLIDPQGYSYARYVGLIDKDQQNDIQNYCLNF